MTNLSDIFLEHKTKVIKFIDDVRKEAFIYGYNKAIDDILKILKFYENEWDGICRAIERIEQLKATGRK